MSLPRTVFAICAVVGLCQSASALSVLDPLPFVEHCTLEAGSIEQIETKLLGNGWTSATRDQADAVSGLAWIGATYYFTGDSGGADLDAILEIKTMSARGLFRKKDIPQSKNRIFVRKTQSGVDTLHLIWRQPVPSLTEIECRAAIGPVLTKPIRSHFNREVQATTFENVPIIQEENVKVEITLLKSKQVGALKSPDAVVQTYVSFNGN